MIKLIEIVFRSANVCNNEWKQFLLTCTAAFKQLTPLSMKLFYWEALTLILWLNSD